MGSLAQTAKQRGSTTAALCPSQLTN